MPPTINVDFLIYTFFWETVLKITDHEMFLVLSFSQYIWNHESLSYVHLSTFLNAADANIYTELS